MIIESKGAQLFFFYLGIALCVVGVYGFANFDDAMFNFCRSTDPASFFNTLNQIFTVIVLIFVFLFGLLLIWWAAHSVRECRKFAEKRMFIDWRKMLEATFAYAVIFFVMFGLVILVNMFVLNDVKEPGAEMREKYQPYEKPLETLFCEATVVSFRKKADYETAPALRNIYGIVSLKLISPESEKGRLVAFEIPKSLDDKAFLRSKGARVKFSLSRKRLRNGEAIDAEFIHFSPASPCGEATSTAR